MDLRITFVGPLVLSVLAAMQLTAPEYGWGLKTAVWLLAVGAAVLQFVSPFPETIPFYMPLILQSIVLGL